MAVAIFIIGLFETMRIEFFFPIAETNFMNPTELTPELYANYLEFKNTYIFTNQPFIAIMNFFGLVGLLGIMVKAWMMGRRSLPFKINNVLNTYSMVFILGFYLVISVMEYLIDVFLNQILALLFNDIVTNIYMFGIIIDYFSFLILVALLLSFLSNQVKYFDVLKQ